MLALRQPEKYLPRQPSTANVWTMFELVIQTLAFKHGHSYRLPMPMFEWLIDWGLPMFEHADDIQTSTFKRRHVQRLTANIWMPMFEGSNIGIHSNVGGQSLNRHCQRIYTFIRSLYIVLLDKLIQVHFWPEKRKRVIKVILLDNSKTLWSAF